MGDGQMAARRIDVLVAGHWYGRALWVASHLKIADLIGEGEAVGLQALAEATGAKPDRLRRILGAVISKGIFERAGDNLYRHNAASVFLRSDHPQSMRPMVELLGGGVHYEAFENLMDAVRDERSAFGARHGVELFDFNEANPEESSVYAAAMATTTRLVLEAVGAYRFQPFRRLVDVGGSSGLLLRKVLAASPEAEGIVFDLPTVISETRKTLAQSEVASRASVVAGSFFKDAVPAADLYTLKTILHDWSDEDCVAILRNVRGSIEPNGRLAIIEMVLPDDGSDHPAWGADIIMMTVTENGRERTVEEFRALLAEAGFTLEKSTFILPHMAVIEATPEL